MAQRAAEPFWRPVISFDPERYETKQVWFPSKDGTKVPMFVVHRAGLELNGHQPSPLTATAASP